MRKKKRTNQTTRKVAVSRQRAKGKNTRAVVVSRQTAVMR